jgi:hypothetical protein
MALPLDESQISLLKAARREIQVLDKQQLDIYKKLLKDLMIKSSTNEASMIFEYIFGHVKTVA